MNSNYRITKVFSILFVIMFTLSSFGAIVSDNDGSAFVTKSEFESLKKDFANQITSYNDSIDGKIDGAIASYLAGIRLSTKDNRNLYFSNWKKITMFNAALSNEWKLPNTNLSLDFVAMTPNASGGWMTLWWAIGSLVYERAATDYAKRIVVDVGPENNANEYAIWIGKSCNLVDSIKIARIGKSASTTGGGDLGHIAWPATAGGTQTFAFINATQIEPGYYSNLDDLEKGIWNPRFQWISNRGGYTDVKEYETCVSKSNAFSIELKKVDDKVYDYEHILNWANYSWPQVTDTDWTKSLRTMEVPSGTTATYTRQYLLSQATKMGKWAGSTIEGRSYNKRLNGSTTHGSIATTNFSGYYSGNYGASDTASFVGVGLVNETYDSEHIYQSNTVFSDASGKNEYKGTKLSLIQGLPLLAANMSEKITIDLEFDNGYRNKVAESDMEVDVFLSLEPFKTGDTVDDNSKRIKCDGQPTTQDYITTTDGKVTLNWTMPENGIVYIKWRPHNTTGTWQVDLNLEKNPTYIIEVET
ncbi:MAG: hypothetical protein J6P02_02075 [Lachnospiraceae bacterium]|nr:hypothetical protein [Lachnospiraceae bacterium]